MNEILLQIVFLVRNYNTGLAMVKWGESYIFSPEKM